MHFKCSKDYNLSVPHFIYVRLDLYQDKIVNETKGMEINVIELMRENETIVHAEGMNLIFQRFLFCH